MNQTTTSLHNFLLEKSQTKTGRFTLGIFSNLKSVFGKILYNSLEKFLLCFLEWKKLPPSEEHQSSRLDKMYHIGGDILWSTLRRPRVPSKGLAEFAFGLNQSNSFLCFIGGQNFGNCTEKAHEGSHAHVIPLYCHKRRVPIWVTFSIMLHLPTS